MSPVTITHRNQKLFQRHVTFRTELEDFEPDQLFTTDDYDDHDDDEPYVTSDIGPDDDLPLDSNSTEHSPSIVDDYCDKMNENKPAADEPSTKNISLPACVEEIDEICEEIEGLVLAKLAPSVEQPAHQSIDDDRFSSLTDDSLDTNSVIAWPVAVKPECVPSDTIPDRSNRKDVSMYVRSNSKSATLMPTANSVHRPNSSSSTIEPATTAAVTDLPRIPLVFKSCCEYKFVENEKLPRYGGYLSQYGLTKAQLERREAHHERIRYRRCVMSAKKSAESSMKTQINEQAFARWLRNKMRTAQSLTRNMYDYVATTGGATAKKKRQSATLAARKQKKTN